MGARRRFILCPHLTPSSDFLSRKFADSEPCTEVIHRNRSLGSHPWDSELGLGYRKSYERRVLGLSWPTIGLALHPRPAFFRVEGRDSPTSIVRLSLFRILGRDYATWTDTLSLVRSGPWLREMLRAKWLRWILGGARANTGTGIPGVNDSRTMGAPDETLVNFPIVLDLEVYRRTLPGGSLDRSTQFVSSGRVQNRLKGRDAAIRAFQRAFRRCGLSLRCFIAGTGTDRAAPQELCEQLGVADSVTLLGWVEPADLQALLRSSEVLVHPSPVQDPFPNAALEGMAAGMAVLGSRACGSVVDGVIEGKSGLIHDPAASTGSRITSSAASAIRNWSSKWGATVNGSHLDAPLNEQPRSSKTHQAAVSRSWPAVGQVSRTRRAMTRTSPARPDRALPCIQQRQKLRNLDPR